MTNLKAQSKTYATRMVRRAEAQVAQEIAYAANGNGSDYRMNKAIRSLEWAKQVRVSMETMSVNDAYDSANSLLESAR